MQAEIGIIGGTGLYDPKLFKNTKEVTVETPYGPPSDAIIVGELEGRQRGVFAAARKKHTIRPTDVNSRANIFALKKLGVQRILASSTVGSLREEYKPGDIVFVDQFIDRTTRREESFYTENRVCHISVAEPMCPELRQILNRSRQKRENKLPRHGHIRVHRRPTLLNQSRVQDVPELGRRRRRNDPRARMRLSPRS